MQTLSPELVHFVFELCDQPTQDDAPEALLSASAAVPDERVPAVADEVRLLWDESLLHTDHHGRVRPTIDGLWVVLQRARELALAVPPGLLTSLETLSGQAGRSLQVACSNPPSTATAVPVT